jgi:hypothetical protein
MPDDLSVLKLSIFSNALDELDNLLAQSGNVFLLGAGCSKCAGLPLTAELTTKALASKILDAKTKKLLTAITTHFAGSTAANIEDYLSELVDLLAIAERRTLRGATSNTATLGTTEYCAKELENAIDQIKRAIAEVINQAVTMDVHLRFVQAVHRPIRPGRTIATRPVDYLVLNYDTLIESALALNKLRYSDGMSGGNCAWWDSDSFRRDDLSARVLKLHGSIDWTEISGDLMPRRVAGSCTLPCAHDQRVLIWPASTKYRETQRDPYAQLFDLARQSLFPTPGSQVVLTICGYSFGDSHINIEIDRALRESDGELTIVAFTADDDPKGELKKWHDDKAISDQVRIYARKGFFHGTTNEVSAVDLPWWKFENITRLLGGER